MNWSRTDEDCSDFPKVKQSQQPYIPTFDRLVLDSLKCALADLKRECDVLGPKVECVDAFTDY